MKKVLILSGLFLQIGFLHGIVLTRTQNDVIVPKKVHDMASQKAGMLGRNTPLHNLCKDFGLEGYVFETVLFSNEPYAYKSSHHSSYKKHDGAEAVLIRCRPKREISRSDTARLQADIDTLDESIEAFERARADFEREESERDAAWKKLLASYKVLNATAQTQSDQTRVDLNTLRNRK